MSRDYICERCREVKSYMHLFWDCNESRKSRRAYNGYMTLLHLPNEAITCYDVVLKISDIGCITIVKMKIIQAMIQITIPSGWGLTKE